MKKINVIQSIKQNESLSKEEKNYLIEIINRKKYGIVWENHPEDKEEEMRTSLPVISEVKQRAILNGSENPEHILIEGDNLHSLTALTFTHAGKIDSMYFDPPYNTGNDSWKYNNKFVNEDDDWRHSKWLSFMSKRLEIAKQLLSPDGLIVITIDDYEVASLTLLMDEIFGEENRLGIICIEMKPGGRAGQGFVKQAHEYALIYAKNKEEATMNKVSKKDSYIKQFKFSDEKGSYKWRSFVKTGADSTPKEKPTQLFDLLYDTQQKKLVGFGDRSCTDVRAGEKYFSDHVFVINDGKMEKLNRDKLTKNVVSIFPYDQDGLLRVWGLAKQDKIITGLLEETITAKYSNGKYITQVKDYLKDTSDYPTSMWYRKKDDKKTFYDASSYGTKLLKKIFGVRNIFPYAKSIYAVKDCLHILENKKKDNAVFLDAFGGSGTTMHAVMMLNQEDGKKRQCITLTNNEGKIAEEVTYGRNRILIEEGYCGIDPVKSNNLRYFKTDSVGRSKTQSNKKKLMDKSTELLCIKENTFYKIENKNLYTNQKDKFTYIIYDDNIENHVEWLEMFLSHNPVKINIYVFSDGEYCYDDEFVTIQGNINLIPIPEAIYSAYKQFLPKEKLDTL